MTISVNGYKLKPGTAIEPGADLSEADLRYADLSWMDLRSVNLSGANLCGAILCGSNLERANLSHANLNSSNLVQTGFQYANIESARLTNANLWSSDLSHANLYCVNLEMANLSNARLDYATLSNADLKFTLMYNVNLRSARLDNVKAYAAVFNGSSLTNADLCNSDLSFADFSFADLRGANLNCADFSNAVLVHTHMRDAEHIDKQLRSVTTILPEGDLIGWKKAYRDNDDVLVKLLIPSDAKRSNALSRKCRCNKAKVLDIIKINTGEHVTQCHSDYDCEFIYEVGKVVVEPRFDKNPWRECSYGIHFFITKEEALNY